MICLSGGSQIEKARARDFVIMFDGMAFWSMQVNRKQISILNRIVDLSSP